MVKRLSNTNQNNNALTNVPTPTNSGDAANKGYVDSAVSSAGDVKGPSSATADTVAVFDGTTGNLIKSNVGIGGRGIYDRGNGSLEVTSLTAVDDAAISNLDVNSTNIVNVADPNDDQDAATKQYVDSSVAASMGVVNHGSNASIARPSGYAQVIWVGSAQPTNAIAGDAWWNNS